MSALSPVKPKARRRGWNLARRLSSRSLLAMGLTSIVVCVLLVADVVGLVPDRAGAVREGRVALAESVALATAVLTVRGDADGLARYLGALQARQPAMTGARVSSLDGSFAVQAGDLVADLPAVVPGQSSFSDARLVLPVLGPDGPWGQVELQFRPVSWLASVAPWLPQAAPLAAMLALFSTLAFAWYLRRMLRHLDPSNAIPARVRTAFDTLAEGLLVLDTAGDIVLANTAFARVAGMAADELTGRSASSLPWGDAEPGQPSQAKLPWLDALSDGRLRYGHVMVLPDANGDRHTFMVNCSPIPGAGGKPAGVLVSLDDVTELEEKEVQLRQARDAAQAADLAKSEFLANMSHEIRTPMNAILGFTELLRRGRSLHTEDAQRHLATIHSSGRHLLELINDILDLSKIESGRLEVERLPCAAHRVVAEVLNVLQVKADEKHIGLRLEVLTPLPATIDTDASRLRQITTNLVGNAIKFTAQGEVRVALSCIAVPDQPGRECFVVDVIDSGIGIPADRLESIFEPFVQAESSTTRQYGGTGLGLTISRRFARALGGDVRATSIAGQGSTFRITLDTGVVDGGLQGIGRLSPADALAATRMPADADRAVVRWRFAGQRVLVVDDGVENRELVRLVLEDTGLVVVEAENGQAALDRVAAASPQAPLDLVLMDIHMPVMDGPTATRQLRARGFTAPIWALTAHAMKGFEREIEDHGFDGYFTKPIEIDRLLEGLAGLLGGERLAAGSSMDTAEEAVLQTPVADAPAPLLSLSLQDPIESRLAKHPRLSRTARTFCDQLPTKLKAMQEAVDAQDWEALKGLAHWLKGAGGSVGYDPLFEPSSNLERAAFEQRADLAAQHLAILGALQRRLVPPAELIAPSTERSRAAVAAT